MRTVEVLFVIAILLSAFVITTQFAVLPSPRQAFGTNLRELAQSTLETLDAKGILTETVFKNPDDPAWGDLQKALSASLPPNIVYDLTVYNLSASVGGEVTYDVFNHISDSSNLGSGSDASSFMVTSPNVTFTQNPQKVGESTGQNITLYILNCNDSNGWWITGYTGQSLATDLYSLLSPYFSNTILVNSTNQLGLLLSGTLLTTEVGESVNDAVVVNTFGEAVPIPDDYCEGGSHDDEGFDPYHDTDGTYAQYFHTLGSLTHQYNWTWVSIVGYPFYYVTNVDYFDSYQNTYGIYGMEDVRTAGINAFLQGLNDEDYNYDTTGTAAEVGVVQLTSEALKLCNYYGIYPSQNQTATRALTQTIQSTYNLERVATVFDLKNSRVAGATFRHQDNHGALTAIGLTRITDIRVAALALLMYYQPTVYRSEFGASGTSRLVTLQLGQQGGT
jgi:archaellum component FlaG (FlaF/FlaG flagellin family)